MARPDPDDLHRRIYRRLTDPTRKSPRGSHRYAYTEEQFDRRLQDEASLPLHEEQSPPSPLQSEELRREQAEELLRNLGLGDRQVTICRMRLEGCTAIEIAGKLGLSERRIRSLLQELRLLLEIRLREHAQGNLPGSDPYYGWQETFLDSQRRQ